MVRERGALSNVEDVAGNEKYRELPRWRRWIGNDPGAEKGGFDVVQSQVEENGRGQNGDSAVNGDVFLDPYFQRREGDMKAPWKTSVCLCGH